MNAGTELVVGKLKYCGSFLAGCLRFASASVPNGFWVDEHLAKNVVALYSTIN